MSAPRQEDATDKVKVYLEFMLEKAERHGRWFDSHDEFFTYLRNNGDLDDRCEEWIDNSINRVLRELLTGHKIRRSDQIGAAQAQSLNLGGPSAPRFRNVPDWSDSGIDSNSLMDYQPMDSPSQESAFDILLVPIAVPDATPHSLRARIDTARGENIIDFDCARLLCGDGVAMGGRVMVGYRFVHDDLDGTKTNQTTCVIGQIEENVVFAKEPPGFPPGLRSGYPMGNSLPQKSSAGQAEIDEDDPEFKKTRDKILAQMMVDTADVLAKKDIQNKKRGHDGDDGQPYPRGHKRSK